MSDKALTLSLANELAAVLDTWGAANKKGARKIAPSIPVGAGMSVVVNIISACSCAVLRRELVELCIAALIEKTDPGIAVMVIPCGEAAMAEALAEAEPAGNA